MSKFKFVDKEYARTKAYGVDKEELYFLHWEKLTPLVKKNTLKGRTCLQTPLTHETINSF